MIFQTYPIPKMPQNPLGAKAQLGHLRNQGTERSAWLDQERLLREDDAVTFRHHYWYHLYLALKYRTLLIWLLLVARACKLTDPRAQQASRAFLISRKKGALRSLSLYPSFFMIIRELYNHYEQLENSSKFYPIQESTTDNMWAHSSQNVS